MELQRGVTPLAGDSQVPWRQRIDSEPDIEAFSLWFAVPVVVVGMSWSLEMLCEKAGATLEMRRICGCLTRACGEPRPLERIEGWLPVRDGGLGDR